MQSLSFIYYLDQRCVSFDTCFYGPLTFIPARSKIRFTDTQHPIELYIFTLLGLG